MFINKTYLTVFIAFILLCSASALAQQENQDEMMKKWMDYMTPGEMHEMMAKSVGEWTYVSKWWDDPSAEPTVSEGRAVNEMIMGGRYLKSMNYGNVMDMKMEGMSILAYDKAMGQFYALWIDNMGTGMTMAKGKYDPKTKACEMNGTMVNPMTGTDMNYRQTMTFIDDNNQLFEMFMDHDGKEYKAMELRYTRK